MPLEVPGEGVQHLGEDFWADFLAYPPLVMPRLTVSCGQQGNGRDPAP
ncbi:hypothetical protein ACTU45_33445 [Streptomyces sp. 24-1644]